MKYLCFLIKKYKVLFSFLFLLIPFILLYIYRVRVTLYYWEATRNVTGNWYYLTDEMGATLAWWYENETTRRDIVSYSLNEKNLSKKPLFLSALFWSLSENTKLSGKDLYDISTAFIKSENSDLILSACDSLINQLNPRKTKEKLLTDQEQDDIYSNLNDVLSKNIIRGQGAEVFTAVINDAKNLLRR